MDYLKFLAKQILKHEAKLVLKKYNPKVIAVIGSVGKSLTKEAIYQVLSKKFFVRKSEKSFTAELGIPLAILGCPFGFTTPLQLIKNIFLGLKLLLYKNRYPQWLILEIDGDKPGDFERASSILSVDILIVTAIGDVPSHVETFYNVDNYMYEEKYIINAVKREGLIIYNADDSQVYNLLKEVDLRKISCGIGGESLIQGSDFKILYGNNKNYTVPTGMSFEIIKYGEKCTVTVFDSIGIHNEYACLLAFATGVEFGLSQSEITSSLNKYKSLPGRMNIVAGIKDSVIIDDSYNSSPVAISQALMAFESLVCAGRKIVVLGDMLELGKYSADEHRKIASTIKNIASNVICVGFRMRKLSEELLNLGFSESAIITADSSTEAGQELQNLLGMGDIVLIKGSQSMRMEKIVEEVMRYPEDKAKVLVRQEPEWLNRD